MSKQLKDYGVQGAVDAVVADIMDTWPEYSKADALEMILDCVDSARRFEEPPAPSGSSRGR